MRADLDDNEDDVIEHARLRRRNRRRGAELSLSMTAMIDVVFLLLIYFVVATDFRMGEEVYRMDLPGGPSAARDPFALDEEPLRIAITSTGLSADFYQLKLEGPYPQPATFDELHDFLRSRQVNETTALSGGGLFGPDHPIVIQPTRRTRWEHAMEAFNSAARANYTNITFAKPG